ncbi:MAG: glycoside hydrolase family 43 protein [Limisphaerales bacterium]
MKRLLLLCIWLIANVIFAAEGISNRTFTNPIVGHGADPWVIWWKTNYYFCQSRPDGVWVNKAARLEDIGKGHWKCVWQPPKGTSYSKQLWAPELHFLQGKWYIYVAADDGDNFNHRMYVLEGSSKDPQAAFMFKGKIAAHTDRWAIDGTVLQMPDQKLYFIWSGWEGANDVAQNLYIAPMSNPWTISGERVCISRPDQKWEQHDHPFINEGPETLWHDNQLFIIYSANGAWGDDYCLGQLTWSGGGVLNAKSWIKKPAPVFSGTADVFGPGHCSFVKSPDGKEDWIVYHAHKYKGSGWERDIRIQRFDWNANGSPNFGAPVSPGVLLSEPSGSPAEK